MVESFYRQFEAEFLRHPSRPFVPGVEIAGISQAVAPHHFIGLIGLRQMMEMRRGKTVGQQPGVGFQDGQGQAVEAAGQVGFIPEHYLVVRGKGDVKGLPHRISFFSLHKSFAQFARRVLPPQPKCQIQIYDIPCRFFPAFNTIQCFAALKWTLGPWINRLMDRASKKGDETAISRTHDP